MAVMVLTATVLGLLRSDRAYAAVQGARGQPNEQPSKWGVLAVALVLALGLCVAGLWVIKKNVEHPDGEPFAWLEGVSIWPTQILQMLLLILTGVLLVGGRVWLRRKIDKVASRFPRPAFTNCVKPPSTEPSANVRTRVLQLWGLGRRSQAEKDDDKSATDPWSEFLDCMQRKPSTSHIGEA
jgi:hypothetical protein